MEREKLEINQKKTIYYSRLFTSSFDSPYSIQILNFYRVLDYALFEQQIDGGSKSSHRILYLERILEISSEYVRAISISPLSLERENEVLTFFTRTEEAYRSQIGKKQKTTFQNK